MKNDLLTDLHAMRLSTGRALFIIATLAIAAYAPTLKVGFLWDDHVIIENNPYIQSWTWEHVKHDFTSDNTQGRGDNYYRPLQFFTHRLDYSLWKLNPFGYHLDNLFIQVANGFLMYFLVLALGFNTLIALMVATLFVVNPIGVETFITPSARTTPLSFCFSLLCVLGLIQESTTAIGLGYVSFILALLTKEFSVITPAFVALAFYARAAPRRQWWVLLPTLPLLAGYFFLRHRAVHTLMGPLDLSLTWLFTLKVFPRMLWHYVFLILCPWNLHSHRLVPALSHLWGAALISILGMLAVFIWKKNRLALFCLGWLIVGLLPTIPLMVRGLFVLDHWGYPIALGILLPLAWALYQGFLSSRIPVRMVSGTVYFVCIIAWSLLTHLNVELRGTDEKMYRWALHFTTSNPIKHNLGVLLLNTDRAREAIPYLEEVQDNFPDDSDNLNALAYAYVKAGNPWMARHLLDSFARTHPEDVLTQQHLKILKVPPKRR